MIFSRFFTRKEKKSSEFSRFIREASSREKKKVFMEVLKKATDDQKRLMREVETKTA